MTPTYNGENNLVGVRWNEDKPSYEYWSQSTNKKGYFVPDVKAFVKEIMQSYFLTFQWEPEDSNKKAVRFALNAQDFKKELKQAQKDGCNLGLQVLTFALFVGYPKARKTVPLLYVCMVVVGEINKNNSYTNK